MTTITARIPDNLNHSLSFVAESMERSKSYIIHKAIEKYIREQLEDIQDAEEALAAMNDKNMKRYSSEEIKEKLEARYRAEHNL